MKTLNEYLNLIPQTLIAIQEESKEVQFCNDEVTNFLYTAYICSNSAETVLKTVKLTFEDLVAQYEIDKDFICEHLRQDAFTTATDEYLDNLETTLEQIIKLKNKTDYFLNF